MTSELLNEALKCDRLVDAARSPEAMRAAISRRKAVRGRMEFIAAMDRHDAENPVGAIAESFKLIR